MTCLTDAFPNYLQGRNETIITLLADTGLRVSELVALDWDHVDLDINPPELFLQPVRREVSWMSAVTDLNRAKLVDIVIRFL